MPALPSCPSCARPPTSSLACLHCGRLLEEPAGTNDFERLGLSPDVPFDAAAAERNYLRLSRALHPDFKTGGDAAALELAVSHSAALNEAWRTLTDDQARAESLLELHHPGALERHKTLAPDFLMEALELSEEIEQANAEGCAETIRRLASEARRALETRMSGVAAACGSTIARIARAGEMPDVPERERRLHPHEWNSARVATLLHQARVYRRILRDAGETP